MATNKNVTIESGLVYDGKKALTADASYNGTTISGGAQTGTAASTVKGAAASDTMTAAIADGKITVIDASKAKNAQRIILGSKATQLTGSSKGDTVISGAAGDKISLGAGNDLVRYTADTNGNNDAIFNYTSNDTIEVTDKALGDATFVDKGNTVTVTFKGSKSKLTVNKTTANDAINFKFSGTTLHYGSLSGGSALDSSKAKLTVGSNVSTSIDAGAIASTIKQIDASGNRNKISIVGNGQGNTITLGSGGNTVYGGYSYDAAKGSAPKSTADKFIGGTGADTFIFDSSLGGSDQITGYDSEKDRILITDVTAEALAASIGSAKSILKDSGKNIVLSLGKSKLTIDGTPKQVFFKAYDSGTVVYGPDLPSGVSVDSKKTTLTISSSTKKTELIDYAVDSSEFSSNTTVGSGANATYYANANYAPKLKTIDASAFEGSVTLGSATSSIGGTYKAGKGGSVLIGGSGNDVFTGEAGSDTFIYAMGSVKSGLTGGKDKITGFSGVEGGDIIQIKDFDSNTQTVTLTEKKGKSLTIAVNTVDDKGKSKSAGSIEIAENPNNKTILVVDDKNKIIATNPITEPIGLDYDDKSAIKTDATYTGVYEPGVFLVGDTISLKNGKYVTDSHTNAQPTIKAADYGAKVTTINAATVASSVKTLFIEGNASVKSVITAPQVETLLDASSSTNLQTTMKGGTAADTFYGSTLEGSKDYFMFVPSSKADKDVIYNYDENDVIVIQSTTNVTNLSNINGSNTFVKFDDKKSDAVLTLDKTAITIKDGAGKQLNLLLVDSNGNTIDSATEGHFLPKGLRYDVKQTSIYVKPKSTSEAADIGGDKTILGLAYGTNTDSEGEVLRDNAGYVALDLRSDKFFNTVKTIDLRKINDKTQTDNTNFKIADNSVHVTLIGNTIANDLYSGGNEYSTAVLWGGVGDKNKPEADRLFGSKGSDVFIYNYGDGKDVIGDRGQSVTTYKSNDVIVLGSGYENSVQGRDGIYITDNNNVLTLQLGTDTKKGNLTITKDSVDTPVKFVLTKDSSTALGVAAAITKHGLDYMTSSESTLPASIKNGFEVFNYGLNTDSIQSEIVNNTNLNIVGTLKGSIDEDTLEELSENLPLTADIITKEMSSAIKNIGIGGAANSANYRFNIVGNNNANQISLGAGGGTVDGGYSSDAKGKLKATADKYYGGAGSDVFVFTTLTDGTNDLGGKDNIYGYDPGNDAIRINSLDDIKAIKYNEKSLALTFNGAKPSSSANVLTINGTKANASKLAADDQITFLVGTGTTLQTLTYTGFNKTQKLFEELTQVINPWKAYNKYTEGSSNNTAWVYSGEGSTDSLTMWHYTDNDWTNNGLNFTIKDFDPENIGIKTNIAETRPTGISIEEPGGHSVIEVDTKEKNEGGKISTESLLDLPNFEFASSTTIGKDGVHIKGIDPKYEEDGLYDDEQVTTINKKDGKFRIANLDGDSTNGYELLKVNDNWKYDKNNNWQFSDDEVLFTIKSGSNNVILDVDDTLGSPALVTIGSKGADSITVGAGIAANLFYFDGDTKTNATGIHIFGFDTSTKFTLEKAETIGEGEDTVATVISKEYILAELDGSSADGYELLKTNDLWSLGGDGWYYSSGTTSFKINLMPTIIGATDDGAAKNVEVGYRVSLTAGDEAFTTVWADEDNTIPVYDTSAVEIDFNNDKITNNNIVFDENVKTNATGIHVKGDGLSVSSNVTVGSAEYRFVELDGYSSAVDEDDDGYRELAKVNENWTPIYGTEKFASQTSWAYKSDDIAFTVNASSYDVWSDSEEEEGGVKEILGVDDNGALKDITVDGNTITFASKLTSLRPYSEGDEEYAEVVFNLNNINLASDTAVGREGIHIKGYASDTTIRIEYTVSKGNPANIEYQLVDLDGDSGNGYELMKVDAASVGTGGQSYSAPGWTYEGKNWSYSNDALKLNFTIGSGANLSPMDDGRPEGVTVSTATVKSGNKTDTATTLTVSEGVRSNVLSNLVFAEGEEGEEGITLGANGLHIVGLNADTTLRTVTYPEEEAENTTPTYTYYQVAEIDGNDNGLEVMQVDSNWSLKGGEWSYSNASEEESEATPESFAFKIAAAAGISVDAVGHGVPKTVTYNNITKTLDLSGAASLIATDLTITKADYNADNSDSGDGNYLGAKGVHIILPTISAAASPKLDTKFTVNGAQYQLVDLDHNENTTDYELMKVDGNWSLSNGAWSYKNSNVEFTLTSDAQINGAAIYANDDGTPIGVSVSGSTITFDENSKLDDLKNLKIGKATYGTVDNAISIVKSGLTEGDTVSIGSDKQSYMLVNLDRSDDGSLELMKVNNNWTYTPAKTSQDTASWAYLDSTKTATSKFAFTLNGVSTENDAARPNSEGTPLGVIVSGTSVTLPGEILSTGSDGNLTNFILTKGTPGSGTSAVHIFQSGEGDSLEKTTVSSDTTTFTLMDADANSLNGYELTYDGWLKVGAKSFRYKSSAVDYSLTGGAFDYTKNQPIAATSTGITSDLVTVSVVGENNVLTFGGSNIKTDLNNFHVKFGHTVSEDDDSQFQVTINKKAFTLADADNNTANGYELTNGGWAQSATATVFVNLNGNFTLKNGTDSNKDLMPDGITYSVDEDGKGTVTFATPAAFSNVTIVSSNSNFTLNNDIAITSEKVDKTDYIWKKSGSNYTVSTIESSSQLPASGYYTSGYDVDDLFNYESPTAIVDDELDDIMEIKPLASDGANDFNVGTMFDGLNDRTVNALTFAEKRRKLK